MAVQILQQRERLNMDSIREMAETVEGSLALSILDDQNNLYLIKGENPISLTCFDSLGLYVYASTSAILKKALKQCRLNRIPHKDIPIGSGEILKISRGKIERASFIPAGFGSYNCPSFRVDDQSPVSSGADCADYDELVELGQIAGVSEEDIRTLLGEGYSVGEIEEVLEEPALFRAHRDELLCDGSVPWWEN